MERRSIKMQLKSQGWVEEAMNTYKPETKSSTTLSEEVKQSAHRGRKNPNFSARIHIVCTATLFSLLKHSDLAAWQVSDAMWDTGWQS